jgi:hypothetical protein
MKPERLLARLIMGAAVMQFALSINEPSPEGGILNDPNDGTGANVPMAGEGAETLTEEQLEQATAPEEAPIEQADPEVGTEE